MAIIAPPVLRRLFCTNSCHEYSASGVVPHQPSLRSGRVGGSGYRATREALGAGPSSTTACNGRPVFFAYCIARVSNSSWMSMVVFIGLSLVTPLIRDLNGTSLMVRHYSLIFGYGDVLSRCVRVSDSIDSLWGSSARPSSHLTQASEKKSPRGSVSLMITLAVREEQDVLPRGGYESKIGLFSTCGLSLRFIVQPFSRVHNRPGRHTNHPLLQPKLRL